MTTEINVENRAKKALVEFAGGAFALTSLDMDIMSLLGSVKVEDRQEKAVPRYILACLRQKYTADEVSVKSITGRLRVFNDRGFIVKHEKIAGKIYPTWSVSDKFQALLAKKSKDGKTVLDVAIEKGWDSSEVDISNPNLDVLNETASVNGRYKNARSAGKVDISDDDVDFA